MSDAAPKKIELSHIDLGKLDLTRKYDDDFSADDSVSWRDHVLLYSVVGFFVVFILWANIAHVDEVTRGEGKVIPSSQTQVIQNLEGGIIDEFLVKEGDNVDAGQVILRMRNVQAQSDYKANASKYQGLRATIVRLQAEADGKEPVFDDELVKEVPDQVRAEQDAFDANRRQTDDQASVLQQQLTQKEQEVNELTRKSADLSNIVRLAKEEQAMIRPAVEKGAAPKMELLQIERQIAQQQTELNSIQTALPRTRAGVEEAKKRLSELKNGMRATAQKELASKTVEMNMIKETLSAFADRSTRTEVKSPVHGKVKQIKIKTVGGVAKPGEEIMEIVPLEDQMVVEAKVKPSDIAFIYPGQKALVKITAYDFSIYGGLEGKVLEISADTIVNEKGEAFYRVRVGTNETVLRKNGKDHEIIPGMTATADIITGDKTVMDYILKPFRKAAQNALTER